MLSQLGKKWNQYFTQFNLTVSPHRSILATRTQSCDASDTNLTRDQCMCAYVAFIEWLHNSLHNIPTCSRLTTSLQSSIGELRNSRSNNTEQRRTIIYKLLNNITATVVVAVATIAVTNTTVTTTTIITGMNREESLAQQWHDPVLPSPIILSNNLLSCCTATLTCYHFLKHVTIRL